MHISYVWSVRYMHITSRECISHVRIVCILQIVVYMLYVYIIHTIHGIFCILFHPCSILSTHRIALIEITQPHMIENFLAATFEL